MSTETGESYSESRKSSKILPTLTNEYSSLRKPSKPVVSGSPPTRKDYEEMFKKMESDIEEMREKLNALAVLVNSMKEHKEVFDDEDFQTVLSQYEKKRTDLELLEADYSKRMNCYNTAVLKLEEGLKSRRLILEDVDKNYAVLKENPEIKEFFVKKQATLTKMYQEICAQLSH